MKPLPLRLPPNADLRRALEATLGAHPCKAAFVVAGIGSLRRARLRLAGRAEPEALNGDLEILTLSGSISADGAHLHMSLADATGRLTGGHVGHDCIVRTTAEVLVVLLPEWSFCRELDPATGCAELVLHRLPPGGRQA
jgi:predicted DNA-binding protein with PD1-like motif